MDSLILFALIKQKLFAIKLWIFIKVTQIDMKKKLAIFAVKLNLRTIPKDQKIALKSDQLQTRSSIQISFSKIHNNLLLVFGRTLLMKKLSQIFDCFERLRIFVVVQDHKFCVFWQEDFYYDWLLGVKHWLDLNVVS